MRRLVLASLCALMLTGCSLFGQSPSPSGSNASPDATPTSSASAATPTPTPTPTPTGPQTPEEYSLFLQERAQVIITQLNNITTGITKYNSGAIKQDELQTISQEAFVAINEQSAMVRDTDVPKGAEEQQESWLAAAKSIQNTQAAITGCLTAKNPFCNAISNTLKPLAQALSAIQ